MAQTLSQAWNGLFAFAGVRGRMINRMLREFLRKRGRDNQQNSVFGYISASLWRKKSAKWHAHEKTKERLLIASSLRLISVSDPAWYVINVKRMFSICLPPALDTNY